MIKILKPLTQFLRYGKVGDIFYINKQSKDLSVYAAQNKVRIEYEQLFGFSPKTHDVEILTKIKIIGRE